MAEIRTLKGDCQIQRELEDLVTDLKSTLITKRLKAVKSLGKLKTPLAVDPLKDVLADRSKEVRCAAIEALAAIGPANLVELMIPLSRDRSADVRLRVAYALTGRDTEEAVRCLLDLMRDLKDSVAVMAAKCLARSPRAALAILIRQFGDKNWKIRSRSAMAVSRMGRTAADALKASLDDPDPNIRFWSAICLGRLRDRSLTKDLVARLSDPETGVRMAVLRALREIGDPSVVGKLFEALSQPSEQVRDLIYETLKDFGTHSIPFLMESLSSEYWMGRSLAARALAEMGSEAISPLTAALESQDKERRFWAVKILGQMREESALPEIRKFLTDQDSEIRMAAVQALGGFPQADTVPMLVERFLDPSWVVRREACRSAVACGMPAVQALLNALGSVEEDVRYWALRALGDIRPAGIFPEIVKLLRDRSWTIRKTASDVLSTFGSEALVELTNLASEGDSEVRYWVLQALGKIGSNISLPLLFRALEDPSEAIRNSAQKALANYGTSILDDLLALFKSDKRRLLESVVQTLRQMPAELVVPRLCQALGKYDEHFSYWIRRVLEGFPAQARKPIIQLLESKANEVRRQAILALGQIGRQEDAETVAAHLKDEHWPARIAAAETLGTLSAPESVEALLDALEDDDEDLSMAACKALGRIGDDRAVPGLMSALQRESWTVKAHAVQTLGRMKARRAIPDLLRMLDEEALDLKIPVVRAIGEIRYADSYKALRERFEREIDIEARVAYIDAFALLGQPAIVPELVELLKPIHPWEERRAAIKALGQLRPPAAQAPLLEVLKDNDPLISREALTALKTIMPPEEFRRMEDLLNTTRRKQEAFQSHFQEGMRQMRLGAMADAERELKSALKINPKAAYVYSALGNLYYKTGKLIDATKAYVAAVQVEPRDITLRLNLGMVYYRRRAYREALATFQAIANAVDPRSQHGTYSAKMIEKIQIEAKQLQGSV
ncbi:MAG: putative lyase [bacterium ADurb.Bin374]|nr:MAG: putative lyase [bacterium ADurb.Bin374]